MTRRIDPWGYKGIATALNGLTNWMYDNVERTGTSSEKYDYFISLVVKYGQAHVPNFKKRGHAQHMAQYVAKKVQQNGYFKHFTDFVKQQTAPAPVPASNEV